MYDSKYDSKMHDIIIPLMGFNGFHHASSTDSKEEFEDFIGRESIIDKLKGWLYDAREDNKRHTTKYSGAYLITGFRGMGKSSFVHKTIHEIQTQKITKKKYVPISINVGNDLLTSRDLLFIICQLLEKSFRRSTRIETKLNFKYFFMKCKNFFKRLFRFFKNVFTFNREELWDSIDYFICSNFLILVTLLLFGLMYYLINPDLKLTSFSFKDSLNGIITSFVSAVSYLYNLIICKWNNLDTKKCPILSDLWKNINYRDFLFVITLLLCVYLRRVFHCLYRMTNSSIFITKWHIKRNFRHIIERIESVVTITDEKGIDAAKNSKPLDAIPGIKFLRGRKAVYPIAQTTEIQDLLINQLSLINRLPSSNLRFIFIIDELDKVSPEDSEIQIIPEYEYTNSVKGNSTYRSRQKALAELLANLKYFISSSEAKFVFITGYDMYETTLSDISNREFNIHSIFNGYINVSSFMRKTGKNTSADSMIEEFVCHMLLDKEKDSDKRGDLRDYAKFFRQRWEKQDNLTEQGRIHFEQQLERRILFLRHFLTYLFYMSNGSPKKIAMYFEKYVRSKDRIEHKHNDRYQQDTENDYKVEITLGVESHWKRCDWFLYFDERSIQKIEFINYLIYPMIKNLIAKSSIYNDKLLVSTSFMISNLYKFHKSGFSWRNLEYMPELLDINKTPELRDFIGGILQFLNQTHVDDVSLNLYKFKFPQRLSEEITFFSKTAEEVSYLFNFSHDELSSIKTLYNKQLKHYSENGNESPAIASLRHLLGDIYILEENYEQAIFEYSEALNAISRQIERNPQSNKDMTKVLFRIQVSLKLGLAFEKRKTFDMAYITYENLVKFILEIAASAIPLPIKFNKDFDPSIIIQHHNSNASLFSHIRIALLAILAKVAVIEKMDLGGIDDHDLWILSQEIERITNKLNDEVKQVAIMDFYNKLGCILYYKNSKNSDEFVETLQRILKLTLNHDKKKFNTCTAEPVLGPNIYYSPNDSNVSQHLLTPCTACQYFNKSVKICMESLSDNDKILKVYANTSKAIFFLKLFHEKKLSIVIHQKGNLFLQVMSNTLMGLANTLVSCAKIRNLDLTDFFKTLHLVCNDLDQGIMTSIDLLDEDWLCPFTKAILYYLAAADSYKTLTDYKASYNIYVQILDAVAIYYRVISKNEVSDTTLAFCQSITRKAIHCAYLHYGSINCAEIDTQKHEYGKSLTDEINLHGLAVFPEIELAVDKYYRICLLGNIQARTDALKKVLNSRQLGSYKLISTLTQNIQNLSLKVTVNEEILSRIMPKLWDSIKNLNLHSGNTISWIHEYYLGFTSSTVVNNLLKELDWHILKEEDNDDEKKFNLLDYLVKDSLYCLNMITELIEPLYSTTLYNHSYIGEFYRKAVYWNHILFCLRELFDYTEAEDKTLFFNNLKTRYYSLREQADFNHLEQIFMKISDYLSSLNSWKNYCAKDTTRVQSIYDKVAPGSSNLLTNSYLTGFALDHLDKAIEMHTSGKAYKEMMSTLYFLEDDLQNDTNYMHLAIERFLINHGILQERINQLREYAINQSNLVRIDNYVKP